MRTVKCPLPGELHPFYRRYPWLTGTLLFLGVVLFAVTLFSLLTNSFLLQYDPIWLERFSSLQLRSPDWLVSLIRVFSDLGSFVPGVIAFGLAGYYLHKKCDARFYLFLVSFGVGLLLFFLLAVLLNRERPSLPGMLAEFPLPSYPSGHVIQAVTLLAPVLYLTLPKVRSHAWRVVILVASILFLLLTGFARMYENAHYPTDVIAGYGVGLAWAIVALILVERHDWSTVSEEGYVKTAEDNNISRQEEME